MTYFSDEIRPVAGIAAASLAIVLSSAAPQVLAQDARTQALERSIRQLEASLQAVRGELEQVKAESARDAQIEVGQRNRKRLRQSQIRHDRGKSGRATRITWFFFAAVTPT